MTDAKLVLYNFLKRGTEGEINLYVQIYFYLKQIY